ncbi:MAG: endonuclease NucS, partial [Fusobacterium necrophorum]|nr:endonuclease NucS [Fusobacterium necrophorum]
MSDINVFEIKPKVKELKGSSVILEKEIQNLIEKNMEEFFGIRFLATEYSITNGRMDSIGIDENNCPVIFEYKRSSSENIINQGLFYLDWLLDHKADFQLLVMNTLGKEAAKEIDWSAPCVFCIAKEFTKFDEHAVNQMQRNIKLVKYNKYGENLILFEHINVPILKKDTISKGKKVKQEKKASEKDNYNWESRIQKLPKEKQELYFSIRDYILSKGDDISENSLKNYIAFKRVKNFVCMLPYKNKISLYLKLNPSEEVLVEDFVRDVRTVGHWGTGDLEIIIQSKEDYEKAKIYLDRA